MYNYIIYIHDWRKYHFYLEYKRTVCEWNSKRHHNEKCLEVRNLMYKFLATAIHFTRSMCVHVTVISGWGWLARLTILAQNCLISFINLAQTAINVYFLNS